jgi:aryl-alcohol dehydrogenase-like predicted oxidoreductase
MERRGLGASGIEVGTIGLGCMGMSWAYESSLQNDEESIRVIRRALELGANLIDTSDLYGPFSNEELVGRALAGRRNRAVLATKCGLVVGDKEHYERRHAGSPEHIRQACEGSLRRLGVDVIDLYYLHRVDPEVPIEESVGAMAELVEQGKVRWLGLSEASVEILERAVRVHPITALQTELSLWTRDALADVVPWCAEHGLAFVAYSPLGRGFLTGRFHSQSDFAGDDFRHGNPRFQPDALAKNLRIAEGLRVVADRIGATPAQVAIAWVLAQGEHVIPIPGTKKLVYLEENLGAAELELDNTAMAELERLPGAVGSRY